MKTQLRIISTGLIYVRFSEEYWTWTMHPTSKRYLIMSMWSIRVNTIISVKDLISDQGL